MEELILTTCADSQQYSACLWNYSTGNVLHYYKNGGVIAPRTLNFIGHDYIVSAEAEKPIIHVWPLNSQQPDKKLETILPEKPSVIEVCPNSVFLAAGISAKLYIWHLAANQLLTIQQKHFQPISCMKFSAEGFYLAVAGSDGMLVVYSTVNLVSLHTNLQSQREGQVEPLYTKTDQTSAITDMNIGSFAGKSKLITISEDSTCKVYHLLTGDLHLRIVFNGPLSALIVDTLFRNVYVGQESGKIHRHMIKDTLENSSRVEQHVKDDFVFDGHEKRITCLALGVCSSILASGSEDHNVVIWNLFNRDKIRTIEHKGAITNIRCLLKHENFFTQNLKLKFVVSSLRRDLYQEGEDFVIGTIDDEDIEFSDDESSLEQKKHLESEVANLRAVNNSLYKAAMNLNRKYCGF